MAHECEACGDEFETLTRLRIHEKDDCQGRATFGEIDPGTEDVGQQGAEGLLTCRCCGRENPGVDYDYQTDYDGEDFHYIAEFDCQHCGFANENRLVMTDVDEADLANLPPHLQPASINGGGA